MPLIDIKLHDYRVTEESIPKIIEALTDALASVTEDAVREQTWVIVQGIPPQNWGAGGKSGPAS